MSKPKVFVAIPNIADIVEDFQTELVANSVDPINHSRSASYLIDGIVLGNYDALDAHLEDVIKYIIVLFKTPSTSEYHNKVQKAILPSIYDLINNDEEFHATAREVLGDFNFTLVKRILHDQEVQYKEIVNKKSIANDDDFTVTNLILNVYAHTYDIDDDSMKFCFDTLEKLLADNIPQPKEDYQDMSKELLIHCVVSQDVNGFNLVSITIFHSKDGVVSNQNAELTEEHIGKTYQTVTDIISDIRKSTLDGQKVYNSLGMSWENPIIRVTLLDLSKDIKNISIV